METAETMRWSETIYESNLTTSGVERAFGFAAGQMRRWILGTVNPRAKTKQRIEEVMVKLKNTKRIPWHPSFGYATPEQIERLTHSIPQYEREMILKQIEKQTKLGGKID